MKFGRWLSADRERLGRVVRTWLPIGFFLVVALFPFYWMDYVAGLTTGSVKG